MFDRPEPRPTPAELIRGLAVFAEPPTDEHSRIAEALGLESVPSSSEYSDLFLFQLYPYASVHLGPEGMMGGEARERVAGFWKALGYQPPAEPDHLAALLGLYATLAEAADGDRSEEAEAQRRLIRESRAALLYEHVSPWVFALLHRVGELAPRVYAEWAKLLEGVLKEEVSTARPNDRADTGAGAGQAVALPLHLRVAPELPDPRERGAADFVAGLLAPVRSGFLLTRADVARIASVCDVGLRAGERRYALEHLLAQDPPAVLRALAAEALRQSALHEERREWLGETASFFAKRAGHTASLLEKLAVEEAAKEEMAT